MVTTSPGGGCAFVKYEVDTRRRCWQWAGNGKGFGCQSRPLRIAFGGIYTHFLQGSCILF